MTAEIAIMNKEAIALAADSAVTMTQKKDKRYSLLRSELQIRSNVR